MSHEGLATWIFRSLQDVLVSDKNTLFVLVKFT